MRIASGTFCLIALLMCASAARAEALYVIEHLVVGVNSSPDGESERITTIRSGDKVEVLERLDDQARIRLPSGEEGWVKASYLSSELPLRQRLTASTQEAEKLRKDIRKLEEQLAEARLAATTAAQAQAQPVAASPEPADPLPPDEPSLLPRERETPGLPWGWVLGSSLVALIAGFALGWRVLDRRIRAKYGGLRIY